MLLRSSRALALGLGLLLVLAGVAAHAWPGWLAPPRPVDWLLAVALLLAAAAGGGRGGVALLAAAWALAAGIETLTLAGGGRWATWPEAILWSLLALALAGLATSLGAARSVPAAAVAPAEGPPAGPEEEKRALDERIAEVEQALAQAVGERTRLAEEVRRLADTDPLTGLPGRRLFLDRLSVALGHAHRQRQKLAVMVLGIDGLAVLPGSLARGLVDDLLRSVAAVLEQTLRQVDTVARADGDEFMILLAGIQRDEDVMRVAEKIRLTLCSPITLDGQELVATASIGIALYPDDGQDTETLIDSARASLARVRERGGDAYEIHAPGSSAALTERQALDRALRRALVQNELVLHYQPIVEAAGGQVVRVEALLRWRNADKRLVPAAEFMPLADALGLSVPLGQWAIQRACTQARTWQDTALPDLPVAVNLSGRQFDHPALVRLLTRVLQDTGLPAASLWLEVPETILLRNLDASVARLRELKELGVKVVVGNFGLGQASAGQLQRCAIDGLKLDRSVIQALSTDRGQEAVVAATIAMAHSLGLEVVAEGVESEAQRVLLASRECARMQGNLFGAPATAEECERLLKRRRRAAADAEPPAPGEDAAG